MTKVGCRFHVHPVAGTGRRSESLTFKFPCSLWPESSEEHLRTSIAGVPSATFGTGFSTPRHKTLCYAIDLRGASLRMTPFWRGLKNIWSGAKNAKRSKKSQALGMTKGRVGASVEIGCWLTEPQVPIRLRSGQALHYATLRSEAVTF